MNPLEDNSRWTALPMSNDAMRDLMARVIAEYPEDYSVLEHAYDDAPWIVPQPLNAWDALTVRIWAEHYETLGRLDEAIVRWRDVAAPVSSYWPFPLPAQANPFFPLQWGALCSPSRHDWFGPYQAPPAVFEPPPLNAPASPLMERVSRVLERTRRSLAECLADPPAGVVAAPTAGERSSCREQAARMAATASSGPIPPRTPQFPKY